MTIELLLLGLLISIPALLFIMALFFTPMSTYLWARMMGRPVFFDAENRKYRTPKKVKNDVAIFKIGGDEIIAPYSSLQTEKTFFGEFGLLYPSNCAIVNPNAPKIAGELRAKGYKDLTEAQVSLALHYLTKQYPDVNVLDEKTYYNVTDAYGKTQKVSGMEFMMAEMEELGVYPFAITAKEIRSIISAGKEKAADELERPLREMSTYLADESRSASIGNYVNEMVLYAKTETLLGKAKSNVVTAMVIIGAIVAVGFLIFLFQKGGGFAGIQGAVPVNIPM